MLADLHPWQRAIWRLMVRRADLTPPEGQAEMQRRVWELDPKSEMHWHAGLRQTPKNAQLLLPEAMLITVGARLNAHANLNLPLSEWLVQKALHRLNASFLAPYTLLKQAVEPEDLEAYRPLMIQEELYPPAHRGPAILSTITDDQIFIEMAQACSATVLSGVNDLFQQAAFSAMPLPSVSHPYLLHSGVYSSLYALRALQDTQFRTPFSDTLRQALISALDTEQPEHPIVQVQDRKAGYAAMGLVFTARFLVLPWLVPTTLNPTKILEASAVTWRLASDHLHHRHVYSPVLQILREELLNQAKQLGAVKERRPLVQPYDLGEPLQVIHHAHQVHDQLVLTSQFDVLEPHPDVAALDLSCSQDRVEAQLHLALAHVTRPSVLWGEGLHKLRRALHEEDVGAVLWKDLAEEKRLTWRQEINRALQVARLLRLHAQQPAERDGREVLAAAATGAAHLLQAFRNGAPVSRAKRLLDEQLKALWRTEGKPLVNWLFSSGGPDAEESLAWDQRVQHLIDTPSSPLAVVAEPEADRLAGDERVFDEPPAEEGEEEAEDHPEHHLLPHSDEERKALAVLNGKCIVIIGGISKPHAIERLKKQLGVKRVDWIPSRRYDHGRQADAHLRQHDVALVVFAVRFSGHAHGSIRNRAWELGVPAISLPGGYNPRQILRHMAQQCSSRLNAA